jgi:hypothetical protein
MVTWTRMRLLTPEEEAENARMEAIHEGWRRPPPLRCYCGRFIKKSTLRHSRSYFGEPLVAWDCAIYPDEPPIHWFDY